MKYTLRVELEVGDRVRLYDEKKDHFSGTVTRASEYREKDDCQRLVVLLDKSSDEHEIEGRIESKADSLGYNTVPVLVVRWC